MVSILCVVVLYHFKVISVKKTTKAVCAKQASHSGLTSRFGGLAAIMTLLIRVCLMTYQFTCFIVRSSPPIFVVGALEDVGYNIKEADRLNAGLVSGIK